MSKIDYRSSARAHVKEAKAFLAKDGESAVRHACLELRMAIEALTYDRLQAYLQEVSNAAMKQWTPKKVLDELVAVDPYADKPAVVYIGIEETPGIAATDMQFLGEEKLFTVGWANKAHNALGNFLHELTIGQHEKGSGQTETQARKKAHEVLTELEPILSASLHNVNMGEYAELVCDCGFTIKRKIKVLEDKQPFVCADCARRYLYDLGDGKEQPTFWLHRMDWTCEACGEGGTVPAHELMAKPLLECETCHAKSQVDHGFVLKLVT